jgi:hypothetical protein
MHIGVYTEETQNVADCKVWSRILMLLGKLLVSLDVNKPNASPDHH